MINWISFQPLIGGMTLGAEQAFGCKPKFILSYKGISNEQHLINYQDYKNIPYILFQTHGKFINENHYNLFNQLNNNIDVVSAVPVCSGLSLQNSCTNGTKARGDNAQQNENMYNITEFSLSMIKPKAFIFENAPGLYTSMGKKVRNNLYTLAKKYNYSISFISTSTMYHGLPQNRQRTFCIIWKSNFSPIVNYYKKSYASLTDLCKSIPKESTLQENFLKKDFDNFYIKYLKNEYGEKYRDEFIKNKVRTTLQLVIKNNHYNILKNYANDEEKIFIDKCKNKIDSGGNIWDSSPSFINFNYINALVGKGMCSTIHPYEERYFNIREMLTLMGMPYDFELLDAKKNVNHIAQNVPVNTSYDWHLEIKKFLEENLKYSNGDYIMQNNHKQQIDLIISNNSSIFDII